MNGFEAHRHFEPRPGQRITKSIDTVADERRMRFNDHLLEPRDQSPDGVVIAVWHRSRIEEVRGVVELDPRDSLAALVPGSPRLLNLRRNRAGRRVGARRIAPEIAHRAVPRTLAAGEKHRADAREIAALGHLFVDRQILIPLRIMLRTRTSEIDDEPIARGGRGGVRSEVVHLYDGRRCRLSPYTSAHVRHA